MLGQVAVAIAERISPGESVALVGIRTGGYHLAKRLIPLVEGEIRLIEKAEAKSPRGDVRVALGAIDISLYRDDVFVGLPKPQVGTTELPFDVEGSAIILVDDVLFTGRTVRAALDALNDYGRPLRVELAVLIDRGRRELPIEANYIGKKVDTASDESVQVVLADGDSEKECVVLRGLPNNGGGNK